MGGAQLVLHVIVHRPVLVTRQVQRAYRALALVLGSHDHVSVISRVMDGLAIDTVLPSAVRHALRLVPPNVSRRPVQVESESAPVRNRCATTALRVDGCLVATDMRHKFVIGHVLAAIGGAKAHLSRHATQLRNHISWHIGVADGCGDNRHQLPLFGRSQLSHFISTAFFDNTI